MDDLQHGARLCLELWGWSQVPAWAETKEPDYYLLRDQGRVDDILPWSLLSGKTYISAAYKHTDTQISPNLQ